MIFDDCMNVNAWSLLEEFGIWVLDAARLARNCKKGAEGVASN